MESHGRLTVDEGDGRRQQQQQHETWDEMKNKKGAPVKEMENDIEDDTYNGDDEQLKPAYCIVSSPTLPMPLEAKKNDFFAGAREDEASQVLFGFSLAGFSVWIKLAIICAGIFIPYGFALYCHEYLFRLKGFKFGWMVTFSQCLCHALISGIEYLLFNGSRKTPLRNYWLVAFFGVLAMGLGNSSLIFVTYPTFLMFKASKPIPTMIGGYFILGHMYKLRDYVAAVLLCAGMSGFAVGDMIFEVSFSSIGILMLLGSLSGDAVVGSVQEKTLQRYQSSTTETAYFTTLFSSIILFVFMILIGELLPATNYLIENPTALLALLVFSFLTYFGFRAVLMCVKLFGSVITAVVTSVRKMNSLIISFIAFARPFTLVYFFSAVSVLSGVLLFAMNRNDIDAVEQLRKGCSWLRTYYSSLGKPQQEATSNSNNSKSVKT